MLGTKLCNEKIPWSNYINEKASHAGGEQYYIKVILMRQSYSEENHAVTVYVTAYHML